MFKVTLKEGLYPDSGTVLKEIGEAEMYELANKLAIDYINDKKNLKDLGCVSLYVRKIFFSETTPRCIGLDYGSYSRFVFINEI